MAEAFTFFGKFGDVCECLDEAERKELMYAICMYGSFGEEIELPRMLKALFVSLKDDIDHSKEARAQGLKGAKKRWGKGDEERKAKEDSAPSDECDSPASDGCIGGHIGGYGDESQKADGQDNTRQCNAIQDKSKNKGARFRAPTVDEVRAHCVDKGYTFDPEAFVAFYESKGWKVGRNPMKSWQAACVTWQKRQRDELGGGVGDEYSNL